MAHVPGCRAVRWSEEFVDILPATGGKVNGLQETLNHLGLTRENCIAFGDGGNDTEMLAFCRDRGCHGQRLARRPCRGGLHYHRCG